MADSDEVTIGITDFAAGELGDIVFVELPTEGDRSDKAEDEPMGTIERGQDGRRPLRARVGHW